MNRILLMQYIFIFLKIKISVNIKGYTEFNEKPVLSNEQLERFNFLDTIWNGNKYLVDGEILYPEGARYPITYDDTPRGLDSNMKIFRKIK